MPPKLQLYTRVDTAIEGENHARLDDYRLDSILIVAGIKGQLAPWFAWVFNAVAYGQTFDTADVRVLDTAGMFDLAPAFHVWAGRFVVPFDRLSLTGPFRNLILNLPGIYDHVRRVGAESGPFGRDTGAAVWGSLADGLFKYHLMVHQLDQQAAPRFTGRLSLSLLDREPTYFVSGTYYGRKNVVAVGAAVQYQREGRVTPTEPSSLGAVAAARSKAVVLGDLWAITADLFAEHGFGSAGTLTFEAAYYRYDKHRPVDQAYLVSLAYLFPWRVGPGQTQLGFRFQEAFLSPSGSPKSDLDAVDVSLAYVLAGFNLRLAVDYERQWLGPSRATQRIALGLQYGYP